MNNIFIKIKIYYDVQMSTNQNSGMGYMSYTTNVTDVIQHRPLRCDREDNCYFFYNDI